VGLEIKCEDFVLAVSIFLTNGVDIRIQPR